MYGTVFIAPFLPLQALFCILDVWKKTRCLYMSGAFFCYILEYFHSKILPNENVWTFTFFFIKKMF